MTWQKFNWFFIWSIDWLIDGQSKNVKKKRRRNKTKFLNQWELRELQIDYNRFFFHSIESQMKNERKIDSFFGCLLDLHDFFFPRKLFNRNSKLSSSSDNHQHRIDVLKVFFCWLRIRERRKNHDYSWSCVYLNHFTININQFSRFSSWILLLCLFVIKHQVLEINT